MPKTTGLLEKACKCLFNLKRNTQNNKFQGQSKAPWFGLFLSVNTDWASLCIRHVGAVGIEKWMNKTQGWPSGGAQSTEQNCALKGYRWRDCWESTQRGQPHPSLRASSVRISQWRLTSSCDSRAGKASEWGNERKEEWLGRNEASWPEELTGAKSGPFWNSGSDAQT